jgi:ABC-type nitrate/sulfonate/bicarbonate transport system substrate-binding protein
MTYSATSRSHPAAEAHLAAAAQHAAASDQHRDAAFEHMQGNHDIARSHPDPMKRVNNGTPRPITVHRSFLERHRDLVVRYLAVLFRSAAWAEAHPQEAIGAIAAEDGRVGEAVIAAAYPHLATSLTPSLSDAYIAGLDAQKNFLRDWGFLASDFATRDWIVEGPLEEAQALVRREARFAA